MIRRCRGTGRLAAVLVATACAGACARAAPEDPGVLTVALANAPSNLDPRVGTDEASQRVQQLLYSSLVRIDDALRVVPELAETIARPDPRLYVVRLRPGVRFHDGRPLTSADVAYTFQSFLDPAFVSPRKGAYGLLERVEAVDARTVRFVLKEPFGSFPVNLVMGIVPAGAGAELARRPVGSGPYRLVAFVPDDRVVLEPFAEHFAGAPRNRGLVLKVVPDDTMRGLELRKGTVDLVVNDLAPDLVHALRADGRLQVIEAPGTDYAYLGVNLRDPVLRDPRVRHAIGYAIDRQAIVEYLRRGLARVALGLLPPASWAFEAGVFAFRHDPARARRLLDEAGYADPDGDGPRPRLRLSLKTSTAEAYRLQAAVIQEDLRRVGIEVAVESLEFATLYADVLRGRFQLYTLQWVGVSDPDMLRRVFHSQQVPPTGFNRGFYRNPEVDRLIEAATVATDEAARAALYREVQRRVAADAPIISLWTKTNVAVCQADLRGMRLTPLASFSVLADVFRTPLPRAAR
jgi:peptide/nickel transport system substrate-binding protein